MTMATRYLFTLHNSLTSSFSDAFHPTTTLDALLLTEFLSVTMIPLCSLNLFHEFVCYSKKKEKNNFWMSEILFCRIFQNLPKWWPYRTISGIRCNPNFYFYGLTYFLKMRCSWKLMILKNWLWLISLRFHIWPINTWCALLYWRNIIRRNNLASVGRFYPV